MEAGGSISRDWAWGGPSRVEPRAQHRQHSTSCLCFYLGPFRGREKKRSTSSASSGVRCDPAG
jgi:hypothetical protein